MWDQEEAERLLVKVSRSFGILSVPPPVLGGRQREVREKARCSGQLDAPGDIDWARGRRRRPVLGQ